MPEPNGADRPWLRSIFSDRKIAARFPDGLPATGPVQDDPRLSRFYNRFYLRRDRSTTNAERATDRKLARL